MGGGLTAPQASKKIGVLYAAGESSGGVLAPQAKILGAFAPLMATVPLPVVEFLSCVSLITNHEMFFYRDPSCWYGRKLGSRNLVPTYMY